MESGCNLWVWLECIGVVSGCCRKDVYRCPHIITYHYSTCISYLFAAASLLLCSLTFGTHVRSEGYCSCPVCMCVHVCMCVCTYVCPLISAASHIGITKQRYQRIYRNIGIILSFADFPASFKSYGEYAYFEQLRHPRVFFPTK